MRRLSIWLLSAWLAVGLIGSPVLPELAQATLTPVTNFAKVTVSTGYNSSATTIVLSPGHGAKLPSSFPFPLVWWNVTDYGSPEDDPFVEIVTVTGRSGDTLTVTRGSDLGAAGAPAAVNHNTVGKVYWMALILTRGMWEKIGTDIAAAAGAVSSNSQFRTGTGSPEGAVVGNPGDVYQRKDPLDNYTTLYVKVTGTNTNTGWIAVHLQPNWGSPGGIGATTPSSGVFTGLNAIKFYFTIQTPAYGGTVTPVSGSGNVSIITVTNNSAFLIANPSGSPVDGEMLVIKVKNASGGSMGAVTWDTQYKMATPSSYPANGKYRVWVFFREGSNWYEYWCGPEAPN